jgi:hypothetical protein
MSSHFSQRMGYLSSLRLSPSDYSCSWAQAITASSTFPDYTLLFGESWKSFLAKGPLLIFIHQKWSNQINPHKMQGTVSLILI